jgi:hypothetical protein
MVEFLSGLLIGTFIGITLMCILQVAKDEVEK